MASQTEVRPSQTAAPAKKTSPRLAWFSGAIVIAIVIVGALWWLWPHESQIHAAGAGEHSASSASSENEDALRVEVVQPTPGGITRKSTQIGTVHAYQEATLYAKASGYLKTLKVDIGDKVKEGEELATIDDPELVKEEQLTAAELAHSQATVKAVEASIKAFEAAEKAADARVQQALAEVGRFQATHRYRQKELDRYQDLYSKQAVPKAIVDEQVEHLESAVANEKSAEAAVLTARADLLEAHAKVLKAQADLVEAQATVDVKKALHEKFQVLVGYLKIISPYTGVVTARNVHPGYFIRSATEQTEHPLLRVARTDLMRVVTYVPDRDVPYVDVNDKVDVALDALNTTIPGTVWRFADLEDPESRTMRTEILLNNKDGKIREGMFGLATIYLGETKAALTIPSKCIVGEANNNNGNVFIVRDGKAKLVPVRMGADDGIKLEIVKGLTADDKVITTTTSVTNGADVVITESANAAPKPAGVGH